jgi:hypothetical protein
MPSDAGMVPFWTPFAGPDLAQGDYLPGCLVPVVPNDFSPSTQPVEIPVRQGDLIVVTQTCDLANLKAGLVALCPIYPLAAFEAVNPAFARKGAWEEVRKGRRDGLHLLASPTNPAAGREALVVNFREIYSLPVGYLQQHAAGLGSRWRLQSPFLEHFSQAFARFFMRVGLPTAVPPITD